MAFILYTYVHEGSERAAHGSLVEVRIVQNNGRGLSTQLQQDGLDVLAGGRGDNGTNIGATSEVDLADGRVGNKSSCDSGGIRSLVENDVQASGRKTSLAEDITEGPEALGRELGALEDDSVTGGEGESDCARAQDEGSVPTKSPG